MSQRDFINRVKDGAVAGWQKYKILPSISIAQAALESGWGGSTLAKAPNYNLFGIKASSDWTGPTVNMRTQEWSASKGYYYVYADFRVYESWAHSIEQHGEFFTNTAWRKNNYRKVIGEKNYKTAAQELRNAGYATDPSYPPKLIDIIERYNLKQYDTLAFDGGVPTQKPLVNSIPSTSTSSPAVSSANIESLNYDDDIFVSPTGESIIYNKTLNDLFGFRPKKGQVMWIERVLKVNSDDPEEMLKEGLKYMKEHAAPAAQYVVSLKELPDTVSIGDTGIFIDHEFNPPLAIEARVLEITTSETVPNSNTVTIGNVKELFPQDKEDILALQRQLQETRDGLLDEFHRGAPLQIIIEGSNGLLLSGNRSDFETELIQGTTTERTIPKGEHVIELYSAKKTDNDFRLSGKLADNIIDHVDDLTIGDPITALEVIVPEEGENPQGDPTPNPLEPQDAHELDVTALRVDFLDGLGQVVLEETVPLYHDAEFTFPIENFNKNIRKVKVYAPKDLTFERISFTEKEANRAKISSTQLVARVYQGNREVTERFNSFSWVRVSEDFRADEGWNDANKFTQANHVTVYADDVEQEESTFVCRLFDDDLQEVLVSSSAVVKIGAEGKSAYQVAVENGFEGTLDEWIDSLRGSDGKNGIPGEPGEDGRTPYLHVAWADSPMGDGFSTDDPEDKDYMGTYTDFTEKDSENYLDYKWMRVKGDKGADGTSIISVDVEYAKNTSKTIAPTSGWTTTAPQWESRSYIWQRIKTTYSVGDPTYSEPHAIETDVANSLTDYVASRGQNLIANGTGMLKDNTNFPGFTFDGSQAYASDGSFLYKGSNGDVTIGEDIPVDPNLSYRFNYYIKGDVEGQTEPVRAYGFAICKDVDGNVILPRHTMYLSGTTTKLARDLNIGDTKIYLEDSSGWGSSELSHQRSIIIWGYKNSYGYEYPAETYSRNYVRDLWKNASSIDKANHVITLKEPWSLGNFPKGREVSNGNSGATYKYIAGINYPIEKQWANYNGTISGIDNTGTNIRDKFHPGTASIQVGWLLNRYADINTWISNVSFMLDNASQSDLNETKEQVKKAVKTITEEYYQSTSATTQTGGTWTTVAPDWQEDKFIFIRSKITYVDNTTGYTPIVNITGAKGEPGEPGKDGVDGDPGPQGEPGQDGVSTYVHLAYADSDDGQVRFSLTQSVRKYVGFYTDEDRTPSTNPERYKWMAVTSDEWRELAIQLEADLDSVIVSVVTESEKITALRTDVDITKNNFLITHTDEYVNKITTTESSVNGLVDRVVKVEETKEDIDTYFQFDDAFTIGKSNAQKKLRFTNEEIQFLDGDTKGTYITGNTMVSQNSQIQDKFNLPKHTMETEGDVTVVRFTG